MGKTTSKHTTKISHKKKSICFKKLAKALKKPDYPPHIKKVLKKDVVYKIIEAKIEEASFGPIIFVKVARDNDLTKIKSTYFTKIYTVQLKRYFEEKGLDLCADPTLIENLSFRYHGEVTSNKSGNTYSNISFGEGEDVSSGSSTSGEEE